LNIPELPELLNGLKPSRKCWNTRQLYDSPIQLQSEFRARLPICSQSLVLKSEYTSALIASNKAQVFSTFLQKLRETVKTLVKKELWCTWKA